MRKLIIVLIAACLLILPTKAMSFTAPTVPDVGQKYMPQDTESFGEGLWYIIKTAMKQLQPGIVEAASTCLCVMVVTILVSMLQSFSGNTGHVTQLVGTLMIAALFISPTNTLISMGTETISLLSEYGKLLLPVMTAALAAQGGITSSAGLYAGTALFCAVLTSLISNLLIPMLYIYLCLSVANSAIGENILKRMQDFTKWLMTWSLKILLYVFTGYLAITGVVSGTADASAVKAAKLAISGVVPVVGNILSDASETILVSAGIMKNAAGIYGLLAIAAVWIGPFIRIGVQYLLTKITSAVCGVFGMKQISTLVEDFAGAMGMILAMTGTVCLLLLVSTVCFMKGVS